jgi:hypothetical protein
LLSNPFFVKARSVSLDVVTTLNVTRHQGILLLHRLGKEQDCKSRPPWCSAGKHPFHREKWTY